MRRTGRGVPSEADSALGLSWLGTHGSSLLLSRIRECGVREVWGASLRTVSEWGLTERAARRFDRARRDFDPVRARTKLDEVGQWFVPFGSASYPPELTHLRSPPAGLFMRGDPEVMERLLMSPRVTIVGTRKASAEGMAAAKAFSAAFSARRIAVLSGMALGIDGQVHVSALDSSGLTAAVLGCGADVVYPARHRWLYERIVEHGLVLSEFPPHSQALKWTFPQRNRLLAALGDAVLVIEGGNASGALQTARWALDIGRSVFAVPNSIFKASGEGCNALIYDGARPALKPEPTVEDFLRCTRMERGGRESSDPSRSAVAEPSLLPGLRAEDTSCGRVLEALSEGAATVDRLVEVSGLSAREVSSALGELEVGGVVVRAGTGRFVRAP